MIDYEEEWRSECSAGRFDSTLIKYMDRKIRQLGSIVSNEDNIFQKELRDSLGKAKRYREQLGGS